jgi:hypothetical protein
VDSVDSVDSLVGGSDMTGMVRPPEQAAPIESRGG